MLAPHTDDAELGCGGLMARLAEGNTQISVVAFSTAAESLPPGFAEGALKSEFAKAMMVLGIPRAQQKILDYPVRRFPEFRQAILEDLVAIRHELKPDMVLLPASSDMHQDHRVIHEEGVRAFRHVTVWGYEMPWNQIRFSSDALVELEQRHLDKQWEALQCYESQLAKESLYLNKEYAQSLARVRGSQIKSQFAESYEVIRVRW